MVVLAFLVFTLHSYSAGGAPANRTDINGQWTESVLDSFCPAHHLPAVEDHTPAPESSSFNRNSLPRFGFICTPKGSCPLIEIALSIFLDK